MKIVKTILNLVISFLLIFTLIGIILCSYLSKNILNKESMLKRLDDTGFYIEVSREIYAGFEDYIYQSGFPEETISELFTIEDIKNDIGSIVNNIYEGKEITLSDKKVSENLENKINTYLEKENIKLTKDEQNNVKKFKNLIINSYKTNIKMSGTLISVAGEYYKKVNDIFIKIQDLPLVLTVVFVFLLVVINIKSLSNVVNVVSISLLSSGVLLKLFYNIVTKKVEVDDLLIISTSLTNLVQNIFNEILNMISTYGLYFIVIGITGIIISAILKGFLPENESSKK